MYIKDLKTLLDQYPDHWDVLISIDEEGNGFNRLDGYSFCRVDQNGPAYNIEPEFFEEDGETELNREGCNAIILWP